MRLALIADTYPPLRTSGAVQLRDLSQEIARQGHDVTVLLPSADLTGPWKIEESGRVRILRLRAPQAKNVGYVRRTLQELAMPFAMRKSLSRSPLAKERWDGIVWYSPSIFHGPLVQALKRSTHSPAYLIIRDIFPEWAVDMGLMRRGLIHAFFKSIARYQYSVADAIGVQTSGNLSYFRDWLAQNPAKFLEVLPNWLGPAGRRRAPIRVEQTKLSGRKVFVYAGNMGPAQNLDAIVDMAAQLHSRSDIGFLFVGRGSDVLRIRKKAASIAPNNTIFFDEIEPDEIPDLYEQCEVGIVSLDPRHRSHNIPGKFLTYLQSGLPVLANVNPGNDLADLIRDHGVGAVVEGGDPKQLAAAAELLIDRLSRDDLDRDRSKQLFAAQFSAHGAANTIVNFFETRDERLISDVYLKHQSTNSARQVAAISHKSKQQGT